MKNLTTILLFVINFAFAQSDGRFERNFLLENELKTENFIEEYKSLDFSHIWTKAENYIVFGVIGKDYQRIKIKIISVIKNSEKSNEYSVIGKSSVKGNICDFRGTILINSIREFKHLHFGVDEEYKDKGIKSQGILFADYEFKENKEQNHSGIFRGQLYSKWYLNSVNRIEYDNIESNSNGYSNNAFIGIWENYSTGNEKLCNWADYRIPKANQDFDIGAGEFSPSEKYYDKGWENYQKAWLHGDKKAKRNELEEWWK